MNLQLIRFCYGPDHVAGLLKYGDQLQYNSWSLENPWRENQGFISCVPDGSYPLVAFDSVDHPGCWVLSPVPNRTGILIHPGNKVEETQGCILIGQTQEPGRVWNSREALRQLNYYLTRNEQHTLTIGPGLGAQLMPATAEPPAEPEPERVPHDADGNGGDRRGEPQTGGEGGRKPG